MCSADGDRWTKASAHASSEKIHGVTWGEGRFIAVGDNGTIVASTPLPGTTDGGDPRDSPSEASRGHSVHVESAETTEVATVAADLSTAGVEWKLVRRGDGFTAPTGATAVSLEAVAWGRDRFVAVGDQGVIVHSTDGDRWEQATGAVDLGLGTHRALGDVAWGAGRFVAVGFETIVHSSDGDRWEEASGSDTWGSLESVAWNGEKFVAVGWIGAIVHSRDGERWEPVRDSAAEHSLLSVTWTGERFLAVGVGGVIVHSADGERWETVTDDADSATVHAPSSLTWNGERFVAVGDHGRILRSRDGERWEVVSHSAVSDTLMSVAWGAARFVAVGDGGAIVHSADGERWEPGRPAERRSGASR